MKLGIAVVYLVFPGDEKLVDIHLQFIERCTQVPFTIYAAANRLIPTARVRLTESPNVRICDIPTLDLRGAPEDAYYLEHLISIAIEDDCTHVAVFHVDSFPIRVGWATELEQTMKDGYAFAAAVRDDEVDRKPTTAGMFIPREFYVHHRPQLLLPHERERSAGQREYANGLTNPEESGAGYGYEALRSGRTWLRLSRTNVREEHYYFGTIHGDLIFHLGASAGVRRGFPGAREHPTLLALRRRASRRLSSRAKRILKAAIPWRILYPERDTHQRAHERVKAALCADPVGFIESLRTPSG